MSLRSDRAVSPVIGIILLVAITIIISSVAFVAFNSVASDVQERPPSGSFSTEMVEPPSGSCTTELRLTYSGGNPVETDNLVLLSSVDVDVGGSNADPQCSGGAQTTSENVTEYSSSGTSPQAGIGDTWTAGESIRFASDSSLDGATIRLVWNPEKTEGTNPGEVTGDSGYILYEETL